MSVHTHRHAHSDTVGWWEVPMARRKTDPRFGRLHRPRKGLTRSPANADKGKARPCATHPHDARWTKVPPLGTGTPSGLDFRGTDPLLPYLPVSVHTASSSLRRSAFGHLVHPNDNQRPQEISSSNKFPRGVLTKRPQRSFLSSRSTSRSSRQALSAQRVLHDAQRRTQHTGSSV